MNVLQQLGSRIGRRHVAILLVAVLVALAGCGSQGGDGSPTPTATETATVTPGDSATPTIEDVDVSAEEVVGPTVAAMEAIESYTLSGNLNQTVQAPNREQTLQLGITTRVDRANQALAAEQQLEGAGQSLSSSSYIVDGTLYQRSQQFVQQYNSEWIKVNISAGIDDQFNRNDELAGHRVMLENSSVDLVGAQTIDGERAYRLELDVDEEALSAFYGFNGTSITLQSVNTTIWVSTETNRVIRAAGQLRQQITVQGQQVTTITNYDERFTYTDVDISLPAAASGAVEVNQTTGLAGA